ncbi:multiple sugar transport system substrate-binding protein [Microbacterium ginsengiterrae]|uniref:Multiple sugar transport system substrate-binding protein n=1 Tax=Microbacterium ginsengiterrae TaxID=546115 RepID=A0A7W9CB04_9MICO|nr:sugar ABC transporter substrate-binding protein [Microbacterium ginsengiterrae]MBB5742282.1 multiple sugar transport system substrate-binding protein [Microbacterium ginsengiterrae]
MALNASQWKRWIALGAVTVLGAGLAGCSASSDGGGDGSGGTITYWASNQGTSVENDEEVLAESIARFTEETGVEVELEVIPWPDLQNRILAAISSGDAPDVLNIGNTWAVSMQATGAFMPWEGEALEALGGQDRFVEASWATGGAEGEAPTSVPLYGLTYSMYYNTKLFEEAGITEPPATWDEFVEDAKALTKDVDGDGTIDQWGFGLAGARVANNVHQAFIRGAQHGGELYDEDGNPDFANDAIVAGVQDWVDLMAVHEVVDPSNAELTEGNMVPPDLVSGRVAMLFDQSAEKNFIAEGFEDWGVAPIPMLTADATGLEATQSHVAGINISVFDDSDNKEAAIDFVAHLTSAEEQAYLNKEFAALPVVTDGYDDPAFDTELIKSKQETLLDHAKPMPLYPSEAQMETVVGQAVSDLFAKVAQGQTVGEEEIRKALEAAQAQM